MAWKQPYKALGHAAAAAASAAGSAVAGNSANADTAKAAQTNQQISAAATAQRKSVENSTANVNDMNKALDK